ncbi:MAG: J domain-containing protein [Nitrososphaeraceae archaeon]
MDYLGYYKTLGVSEDSSYPDIRKAYRRLAKRHHPDKPTSCHSGDMIKMINAAFEILSDWKLRGISTKSICVRKEQDHKS